MKKHDQDLQQTQFVQERGIIHNAVSGFYYVWAQNASFVTKPRGNFRHQKFKPLVGDQVVFEYDPQHPGSEGRMIEILPRHNELIRPTIANVDHALVVTALVEPDFSYNLLDYFLVSVEAKGIQPLIVLTKEDLLIQQQGQEAADKLIAEIKQVYQALDYEVLVLDGSSQRLEELKQHITQGLYVIMGQSGVGKSTLLNALLPDLDLETAQISDYLNRGKHTTRQVTLYQLNQALMADTPGFSAIEFDHIDKEELSDYFPEMRNLRPHCRFRMCSHLNEPGCKVKEALESGQIASSRYQNYCQIYEKIEQRKPMYRKK
ncbi:ribosome small subunit-dependent GTPase A [Vaginisenegalia massiliensis]|uniref:ribosome small subunit-dependent GTPase A n=1 Tax=Vaginisenegalia massiliensis TaxID=2058294 RepID=UPI000F52B609|nr:ribosome small subunit-dependent GTPase A [Vaginisenegalia massiliensis]